MKKHIPLFITLISLSFSANAQLQRLALLPDIMQGAGSELTSLCIDLFRDAPSNIKYSEIGNEGQAYSVKTLNKVERPGTLPPSSEARFIGQTQDAIPEYYEKFLKQKISEYDKGSALSEEEITQLQLEVWAYNGMDELGGFIQKSISNPITDFENAKKDFCFRYGLEGEETDAEAIVSKLYDLHEIKKSEEPLSFTDFEFTNDNIHYKLSGSVHTIQTNYDGVTFGEMQPYSDLVNKGVTIYSQNYYSLPDLAEFSHYQNKQHEYLLSFEDDYGDDIMNFIIANGRLTIIDLRNKEISVCYVR